MPIATPEIYAQMLDRAKAAGLRLPGHQRARRPRRSTPRSRASPRPRATASSRSPPAAPSSRPGQSVKDMVTGAVALAEFAHVVADQYPVNVALHTDHCPKDKLDGYMRPLVAISAERVDERRGAAVPVAHVGRLGGAAGGEPRDRRGAPRAGCAEARIILEIEIGVVGGEEDGVVGEINEKLYTTPEDALATADGARPGRARPLHARRDLRQRARRLQARATSSCARASSRRSRTRSAPSTARTSRSTWSSTAAPARVLARSARRSTTAW